MDENEFRIRKKLHDDLEHYALKCLKIRTKSGAIEPFVFNKAQKYIHTRLEQQLKETGKVRAIILKSRQQGSSTYIGARLYHKATYNKGYQAFILTHSLEATNNLFKMAKRFYEHTPLPVRPDVSTSNAKELIFGGLDSGYKLGTAENKNVGRSSTIQLAHLSETAFWNNAADHAIGIMQAIPDAPGTEAIMESTPNGVGNYFHQQWQMAEAGLSDFIPIFIPWSWQEEYTKPIKEGFTTTFEEEELRKTYGLSNEQINWRRSKIVELSVNGADGEAAFKQEYSLNPIEAFRVTGEDSFITSELIMKARKHRAEKYGPLIIGVDPARFGPDRTGIIRRQGRVAFGLESYTKKDTMEIVGIVKNIIEEEKPAKVFIDVGGLGAGIVDRLRELFDSDLIVGVNAGSSPFDARKYSNKRAEMWGLCKEWLMDDGGAQIPDSDELHADLAGIHYKIDSNSRLVMEQKADMKRRGVRSSDLSDALCLTFSAPVSSLDKRNKVLDKLASSFGEKLAAKQYLR